MNTLKRKGPITEPNGTTEVTRNGKESTGNEISRLSVG
jgi:hypothetical protein